MTSPGRRDHTFRTSAPHGEVLAVFDVRLSCSCAAFLLLGFAVAPGAFATPIGLTYQGSYLEGAPGVDQSLPIFLSGSPNNVRLKFFVPDFASLVSITSIDASVNVYDDGDTRNPEEGAILFVLNGAGLPNLPLQTFGLLDVFTAASPLTVSGSVDRADLPHALFEIQQDGTFFIRVNRDANDFFVQGASVQIDGEVATAPEPASIALVATGLIAVFLRRRSRRSVRDG